MDSSTIVVQELLDALDGRLPSNSLANVYVALVNLLYKDEQDDRRKVRKHLLKLVARTGNWQKFQDAEFVDGLGTYLPPASLLLKLAFETAEKPSEAAHDVSKLASAGAFDDRDEKFMKELHSGIQRWHIPQVTSMILLPIVSELNTYGALGRFLREFFEAPCSTMTSSFIEEVLHYILQDPDIRDLGGDISALCEELPMYVDTIDEAFASSSDSEEDERGNLRGFIIASDSEGDSTVSDDSASSASLPVVVGRKRKATAMKSSSRRPSPDVDPPRAKRMRGNARSLRYVDDAARGGFDT